MYFKKMISSAPIILTLIIISALHTTTFDVSASNNKTVQLPLDELQQFTQVIDNIKKNYVKDTTDKQLFEDAIRGMLTGLDPHSAYLDEDTYADLKVTTTGKFGGLGIEVTMEDGFVKVVSPIDDTPAQRAGIKAGDLIIRLNDTPVKGLTLREAVVIMRGKKGSSILLTIVREGTEKPLKISVVRDIIRVKSIKSELLEPGYGYLRITHFQTHTADNALKAITSLQKKSNGQLKGLVLDLRNNPGGILEGAVKVSDIFLDARKIGHDQLIVYTEGRQASDKTAEKAHSGDLLQGKPIVILVNEGSASASEIVAGALQDHRRAIIIGEKTFGKGSVQTVLPLTKKSGLKLTTAFYYTPAGHSIQAEGIEPDIILKDVTIKTDDDNDKDGVVREANLQGHFKHEETNENGSRKKSNSDTENNDKVKSLLEKDYQINEALNLLKGITIMGK